MQRRVTGPGAVGRHGDETATRGAVPASDGQGGALLIDLENMVGQKASVGVLAARLEALIECAGPGVTVVAACATSALTSDGSRVLRENGVMVLDADDSKNAAEQALLAEAERMARAGCRRFVAASNDSRLKQLADLGELEIILWWKQKPSSAYITRAEKVHRLAIPPASRGRTAVPPVSTIPRNATTTGRDQQPLRPHPVQRLTAANAPAHGHELRMTTTEHPDGLRIARLSKIGAAWLAAGVLFGAGGALGDVTIRGLLGRLRSQ